MITGQKVYQNAYMQFVIKDSYVFQLQWQITQTQALMIPHILCEPNTIIVLLFISNILHCRQDCIVDKIEEAICIFKNIIGN
jgi:hypothetical protein